MAKTRADLLALAQRRYTEVDGWRLQSLTELERSSLQSLWSERYEKTKKIQFSRMRSELLIQTLVDDAGCQILTAEDVTAFAAADPVAIDQLYYASREHSGFDEAKKDELEKKSDATDD